jgi:hypothetical protein
VRNERRADVGVLGQDRRPAGGRVSWRDRRRADGRVLGARRGQAGDEHDEDGPAAAWKSTALGHSRGWAGGGVLGHDR